MTTIPKSSLICSKKIQKYVLKRSKISSKIVRKYVLKTYPFVGEKIVLCLHSVFLWLKKKEKDGFKKYISL